MTTKRLSLSILAASLACVMLLGGCGLSSAIVDERANEKSVMLLCGIGTDEKKLERLKKVLRKLKQIVIFYRKLLKKPVNKADTIGKNRY